MDLELFIYNVFKLSDDILSIIYLQLNIEYLEILELLNKNLLFLRQKCFWEKYFRINNLKIINDKKIFIEWITEFKSCSIVNKIKLKHTCIIQNCTNKVIDKFLYCNKHINNWISQRNNNLNKYILLKCENFDFNFIKQSNYGFKCMSFYLNYKNPELIIKINNITLYVENKECTINNYEDITLYNLLYTLFFNDKINTIEYFD